MQREILAFGRHREAMIADLRGNTHYTFMIAGVNNAGVGPFSLTISLITPGGKHVFSCVVRPF